MPTKETLRNAYKKIRAVGPKATQTLEAISDEAYEKLAAKMSSHDPRLKGKITKKGIILANRLANSMSEDEFVGAFTSGELPALKLSPAEMELLMGGKANNLAVFWGAVSSALSYGAGMTVMVGPECGGGGVAIEPFSKD
jgi:hypothetical protein